MRDGLHHGAPVGPRWKSAIRDLAERADFAEAGARRISAAVLAELKSELRPTLIDALLREVDRSCQSLFPDPLAGADRSPPAGLRNDLNDAEQAVVSAARRRIRAGGEAKELVQAAVGDVVQERLDANRRQALAHVRTKAPRDASDFQDRWIAAEALLDRRQLSRTLVEKSTSPVIRAKEPPLDLDANILKVSR